METYTEAVVVHYMLQLLDALNWLHKRNLAHLDIKPENVYVVQQQLKLIDFGETFGALNRNTILPPSNLEFSAPEMVLGQVTIFKIICLMSSLPLQNLITLFRGIFQATTKYIIVLTCDRFIFFF